MNKLVLFFIIFLSVNTNIRANENDIHLICICEGGSYLSTGGLTTGKESCHTQTKEVIFNEKTKSFNSDLPFVMNRCLEPTFPEKKIILNCKPEDNVIAYVEINRTNGDLMSDIIKYKSNKNNEFEIRWTLNYNCIKKETF